MLSNLTGWHFVLVLVVVLLLFGAPKLPGLARSVGQSLKIFKSEIKADAPAAGTVAGTPRTDTPPVDDANAASAASVDPTTKP